MVICRGLTDKQCALVHHRVSSISPDKSAILKHNWWPSANQHSVHVFVSSIASCKSSRLYKCVCLRLAFKSIYDLAIASVIELVSPDFYELFGNDTVKISLSHHSQSKFK